VDDSPDHRDDEGDADPAGLRRADRVDRGGCLQLAEKQRPTLSCRRHDAADGRLSDDLALRQNVNTRTIFE